MEQTGKSLTQLQTEAAELLGNDLKHPRLGATLGLVEELGELVKEVMELEIYGQEKARGYLGGEVADILFSLLEVCNAYDISLEEAYATKLAKIRGKREEWVTNYSENLAKLRAKLD